MELVSTYDYERIGRKEIRLCRFLYNGPEISAELKTFTFRDNPPAKYIALSYSWEANPAPEKYDLRTDQKPLRISASLKDFVDELRSKSISRSEALQHYWWIDSICINQGESVEKGWQVQRMRDIYQQAYEVVVWLGKETCSSQRAQEFIEYLNKLTGNRQDWKALRAEEYRPKWEDLKNFFDRAWWARVWTVQECSIPSKLDYWCGSRTCSRQIIFKVLEKAFEIDPPSFKGSTAFHHAWNRRRTWKIHDRIRDSKDEAKRIVSLPALAAYFCDTEVTYDRDRLFGFAALATESFTLEPDFNSSTDDVYLRFARSFIDFHKSLDIIMFAPLFNATPGSLLPSWVPDWRRRRQPSPTPLMVSQSSGTSIGNLRHPSYHDFNCKYSASGDEKVKYGFDITRLLAWGCIVGEVEEIAGSHNGDRNQSQQDHFPLSDAEKSTMATLVGICRCLTLNRKDRYLRKPMPEKWFNNDFIHICLRLNHGFSLSNSARRYASYSDSGDTSDEDLSHAGDSNPAIPAPPQTNSIADIPDYFKQWFKSVQSLHIGGTTFEALLNTFKSNTNTALSSRFSKQKGNHSSFYMRFCDTTGTMSMKLMNTRKSCLEMAPSNAQYKPRIGMAPPGAQKGDQICILFGCSVPVVLRKLERSDEYVLIGECYLDECMNGEAIKGVDLDKKAQEFRIV